MSAIARGKIEIEIKKIAADQYQKEAAGILNTTLPGKVSRPETNEWKREEAAVLNTRSHIKLRTRGRVRSEKEVAGY